MKTPLAGDSPAGPVPPARDSDLPTSDVLAAPLQIRATKFK